MLEPTRYVRKPFYVEAVQVTEENIEEVAQWCAGPIRRTKFGAPYIKVHVHQPRTERQTKAFVGDHVLKAVTGFKVYTTHAFQMSFELDTTNHLESEYNKIMQNKQ